ncbi:hypothetical protein BCIN_06g00170 [Botrytis cinerea B05.10]|uniref:Uncharacterized protein n=1 Tax=Botryotinia fuckeliana (strain B05.10) TaxID=332648 RepID=A0A384JIV0_BOTFB|nr:hypothetical protein BCIN_06g00170 [Botrytis cinerea B05.10]ATZ50515.1 hypothetical protein BCIN_06g00170 [Botrytis cinerea B05.10]
MLFQVLFLSICLYISNSSSAPHPYNSSALTSFTSGTQSTENAVRDLSTKDILCWYGTAPPPVDSNTYVYEILENVDAFNFYVCDRNLDASAKVLVQLGLSYNINTKIDTRQTPLVHNISVRITNDAQSKFPSSVWYRSWFLLPTTTSKVLDGRIIGWQSFDNCETILGNRNAGIVFY